MASSTERLPRRLMIWSSSRRVSDETRSRADDMTGKGIVQGLVSLFALFGCGLQRVGAHLRGR